VEAFSHPFVDSRWHREDRWKLIQAAPWKDTKERINVKEGRVLLMGLRRWGRSVEHLGRTVFSLSDNLVSNFPYVF